MWSNGLRNPAVRAFVSAVNDSDRDRFDKVLAFGATMSDDGSDQDLDEWVRKEIFAADGRMDVESEEEDGLRLVVMFTNSKWGTMRTNWSFTVEDGRVTRFDTEQA